MHENFSDLLNQYKKAFHQTLFSPLFDLAERGFMSPSLLSDLIMKFILPAQDSIVKNIPLAKQNIIKSLTTRSSTSEPLWVPAANLLQKNHTLHLSSRNELEILEATNNNNSKEYVIYFCGNEIDAVSISTIYTLTHQYPEKNIIFWNYPNVGTSKGAVHSPQDLFKAGFGIANDLLNRGIAAENITLHGYSLGGGVATHVARWLHEKNHLVHLTVDRSFGQISSVVLEHINANLSGKTYAPLLTSIMSISLLGISLGTTTSGILASLCALPVKTLQTLALIIQFCTEAIGIICKNLISLIGQIIAFPFSFVSEWLSDIIKDFFNFIGEFLELRFYLISLEIGLIVKGISWLMDNMMNLILSIAGGTIAFAGALAGAIVGLFVGAILSLQNLWTEKPYTIPLALALKAVLRSTCCEIDSVDEMHRLLNADQKPENNGKTKPNITVINTKDDQVIPVEASLNKELFPRKDSLSTLPIQSFWYRTGDHCNALEPNQLMSVVEDPDHPNYSYF